MSTKDSSHATAYDQHGSGPPLVLIHGMGMTRSMWKWQLPDLVDHFTVITYDLLGHGDSASPQRECTLTDLSEQLSALLDHLQLTRVNLAGFSLGGMIARRFAIDHPQAVNSLGILHSAHARTAEQSAGMLERLALVENESPSGMVDNALERWFSADFRAANPDMMQLIREWMGNNNPTDYVRVYAALAKGDAELAEPIAGITCPTLLVSADEDFGNSPLMAQQMAEHIKHSEVVIHAGLRHMALAEDPAAFNPPLVKFFRMHGQS